MPQQISQEIITAAIAGFESQKSHTNSKIAEVRNMLDHRHAAAEAPQLKRKMSAASRRRIALPKDLYQARSHAVCSSTRESTLQGPPSRDDPRQEAPEPGDALTSALELAPTGVVGPPAKVSQGEQSCSNSRRAIARSLEGVTVTVVRREHNFEFPRYVIAWDGGGDKQTINPLVTQSEFFNGKIDPHHKAPVYVSQTLKLYSLAHSVEVFPLRSFRL